jgi:hypothetical protein
MLMAAEQAAGLLQGVPDLLPVDVIEEGAVVGICYKVFLLARKSAGALDLEAWSPFAHLVIMFKLDTLIHVPTCLEKAQAICPQHREHRVLVGEILGIASKVGFLNHNRLRHHDGF